MAMNYNRELLFSAANKVSSCTLSESFKNFSRVQITYGPNYMEIPTDIGTYPKIDFPSYYSTETYMFWPYYYSAASDGKGFSMRNFNLIVQNGTAAPRSMGSAINRANNIKAIIEVWGIGRVSGSDSASANGVPLTGVGWTKYNETVLCSARPAGSVITLSEPASGFERLKFCVGVESKNIFEYAAPTADGNCITVRSFWGGSTASNVYSFTTFKYGSGTTQMSATNGKFYQLGYNSGSLATGNITASDAARLRPVYTVIGVNRK